MDGERLKVGANLYMRGVDQQEGDDQSGILAVERVEGDQVQLQGDRMDGGSIAITFSVKAAKEIASQLQEASMAKEWPS